MPYKHIRTEEEIEEVREETEDREGHDTDAILERYVTPDEAIGMVVKHDRGHARLWCRVAEVDPEDRTVTLERLFDPEATIEVSMDDPMSVPFIGNEYTASWIEARIDGEWERVSDVSTGGEMGPYVEEDYEETRVVEKSYTYGSEDYDEWPIRVSRRHDGLGVIPDNFKNEEALQTIFRQISLPEDADLNGLQVGSIFTKDEYVENDEGEGERIFEIVWYNIDPTFRASHYTTPVECNTINP